MDWKEFWENAVIYFEVTANNIRDICEIDVVVYLVIAILVLFAIMAIYDNDNENSKIIQAVSRFFKRFVILLADLASDIISLLSSLSEIINLIRILIFGKLDSQTQVLLANYAIIFLSVVSFVTTKKGLDPVIGGWESVLASFGVQVGILVFSGRIAKKYTNAFQENKKSEKIYKVQCRDEECDNCANDCKCQNRCGKFCEECAKLQYLPLLPQKEEKLGSESGKEKIIIIISMVLLMSCSMFFSYNSFWQQFVLPSVTLEEYTSARMDIVEAEEEYSKSIKSYQQSLEGVLQEYHNRIMVVINTLEYNDVDENISSLTAEEEKLTNEIEQLEKDIEDLEIAQIEAALNEDNNAETAQEVVNEEENSVDYAAQIKEKGEELEEKELELTAVQTSLGEETGKKDEVGYEITMAMDKLTAFYADPLNADAELDEIRTIWGELQSAVARSTELEEVFTSEQKTDLDIVFSNYLELCQYYRDNDYIGFKAGQSNAGLLSSIAADEREEEQKRYLEETKKMLESIISDIESVPDFETVSAVWEEGEIKEESKVLFLEQLYADYRECSGMVEETEKAIRGFGEALTNLFVKDSALSEKSKWITFFVAALAVFVDTSIVLISIWKGDRNANRSSSDMRRLVGALLIKTDRKQTEAERRMQLSLAFGILFGILLYVVQILLPAKGADENVGSIGLLFVYCMCGLLVSIIIGKAIGRAQKLSENDLEDDSANNTKDNSEGKKADDDEEAIAKMNRAIRLYNQWRVACSKIDMATYGFADDAEERIRKDLYESVAELFDRAEWKTICEIEKDTKRLVDVRKELCVLTLDVKRAKWNIEFAILKSYRLVVVSDDGKYFMMTDMFWKMLYVNLMDKISGNLTVPLSMEDMLTNDEADESK